jgi:hypothetical protein
VKYVEDPVFIEETAPEGHVEAVEEAFAEAGFEVRVAAGYGRKAAGALDWVVHITLAVPIVTFFASFASEAGKDAYASVKEWTRKTWRARRDAGTGEGSIVLRDPEGSNLILSTSIPPDALDALRDIDWNESRGGYLVWDSVRREWRDPRKRD